MKARKSNIGYITQNKAFGNVSQCSLLLAIFIIGYYFDINAYFSLKFFL